MRCNSQNHLKHLLIMEFHGMNRSIDYSNNVTYKNISIEEISKLPQQNFTNLSARHNKGAEVIGIFSLEGDAIGFGCVQKRGQKGDYFRIRECDFYISDLYIYPDYRGKGYMSGFLNHLIKSEYQYRLCVRSNNVPAKKCYEKFGFKLIKKVTVLRIYKDISFPITVI